MGFHKRTLLSHLGTTLEYFIVPLDLIARLFQKPCFLNHDIKAFKNKLSLFSMYVRVDILSAHFRPRSVKPALSFEQATSRFDAHVCKKLLSDFIRCSGLYCQQLSFVTKLLRKSEPQPIGSHTKPKWQSLKTT